MVFPGVDDVFAIFLLFKREFISDDLPTLDLPTRAYSGSLLSGHWSIDLLLFSKTELITFIIKLIISYFPKATSPLMY